MKFITIVLNATQINKCLPNSKMIPIPSHVWKRSDLFP